jgi:hypothetical protein
MPFSLQVGEMGNTIAAIKKKKRYLVSDTNARNITATHVRGNNHLCKTKNNFQLTYN